MADTTQARGRIRWLPLVMLVALGALWGGNPSFSKALVAEELSPAAVVFWQTFLAGALLLLVCAVRGIRIPLTRKAIVYYLVIGLVGIDLSYMTLVFVVHHVPAGYAAVVILLSPVLTYVFAVLLRLERVNLVRASGIALGFVGAGFLVFPEGSLPSPDLLPVALLAFVIPAGYAAANVYSELGRPAGADNVALATATMFAAALGAVVVALAEDSFHPVWHEIGTAEWLLLGYAIATGLAFLLFYKIVESAGAVYLGQVGYLVTLFGVAWGVLFFGESTTVWLWVAVLVVGTGVALVNLGKGRTESAS
ncbi:MAG: DMT family transporter [Alphaproteobacteria bacterium]|nr:DMT family transporter [Alphaproteobacteria bacterium]